MWLRVNFRTEVQLTIVVSKRELTRQYINARNSGRRQARKPRRAAQNVREKLGVLPNLLTALAASPGPCPVQQSFRAKKPKTRVKRNQKSTDPNMLSPHSRERWLARSSRRSAKRRDARQANKTGIQIEDGSDWWDRLMT